jgi:hypothetical protein
MKAEDIKNFTDTELLQVLSWEEQERKARTEKRKQETLARIRELAQSIGVAVTVGGQRGRPAKGQSPRKDTKG